MLPCWAVQLGSLKAIEQRDLKAATQIIEGAAASVTGPVETGGCTKDRDPCELTAFLLFRSSIRQSCRSPLTIPPGSGPCDVDRTAPH